MSGNFEKGKWKEDGIIITGPSASVMSIEPSPESPIISQLERVATMLNLHPLTDDEMKGEIIIKGQDGHWYRILDIIESFLKRMK